MRSILLGLMALVGLVLSASAIADAPAAPPETLTVKDLANRPDRWPPSVTLQREFDFNGGAKLNQGDKASIIKFDGSQLILIGPKGIRFQVLPEDCALLDAANQYWSGLTPAQRAVNPDSLAADCSIWPVQVMTTMPVNCQFGNLPAGSNVILLDQTNKESLIGWPKSHNRVNLDFTCTNVFDEARRLVAMDKAKRPSRVAAVLDAIMVGADGKPVHDEHLQDKQIFAFYFGAGWCGPCRDFSPGLVKFANDALAKHPELAIVMMNDDKSTNDMLSYMKDESMTFPAVQKSDWTAVPLFTQNSGKIIPDIVAMDRFGKVLAANEDRNGNRGDPNDTLTTLNQLLSAPAVQ